MKLICRVSLAPFFACVAVYFFTALTVSAQGGQQTPRPSFPATTTEKFDASTVPAYGGNHAKAYAYINGNLPQHIENLRRWVQQRSISAQNDGVKEMAALLRDDLRALGFKEAEVVPTSGHPGVWGYYDAGA